MLTLPITKKWYDMILAKIKLEEYRKNTPYYQSRFAKHIGSPLTVRFRNGYGAGRPTIECEVIPQLRSGGNVEWGADPSTTYFTLEINSVCLISN